MGGGFGEDAEVEGDGDGFLAGFGWVDDGFDAEGVEELVGVFDGFVGVEGAGGLAGGEKGFQHLPGGVDFFYPDVEFSFFYSLVFYFELFEFGSGPGASLFGLGDEGFKVGGDVETGGSGGELGQEVADGGGLPVNGFLKDGDGFAVFFSLNQALAFDALGQGGDGFGVEGGDDFGEDDGFEIGGPDAAGVGRAALALGTAGAFVVVDVGALGAAATKAVVGAAAFAAVEEAG